jgi:hypothetical protein
MIARLIFLGIAAFWVTMNVLLWRAEYGAHGGQMPVPMDLVWRRILTAPDASSLSVYQNGDRTGFCEFSTSVEQEMAKLDADRPPPEGIVARAGYQIHCSGNLSLGDFTNRVKFDGRVEFSPRRDWREINLKISLHGLAVEIHSVATNQTVRLIITSDGAVVERNFGFADLQNPNALIRAVTGNSAGWLDGFELPVPPSASAALAQGIHWQARRDRVRIGAEPVPAYRLETRVLDYPVVIYVSTLGEILRVELPNDLTATIDEWSPP